MSTGAGLQMRFEQFADMWLSNPSAQADFAELIEEAAHIGREQNPVTFRALTDWVDECRDTAQRLGLRRGKRGWL